LNRSDGGDAVDQGRVEVVIDLVPSHTRLKLARPKNSDALKVNNSSTSPTPLSFALSEHFDTKPS
jgi:hypothetical protein